MKKTLIALAAVAVAGAASAQVTMYGKVDLGLGKAIGQSGSATMQQASSSRWGVKGTEDLGGGLSAVFAVESRFNPDTGEASVQTRLFHGQTVVGLSGGFGTVKMGRYYTPAFLGAQLSGDPFGWDGIANQIASTGAGVAVLRFNNGIYYNAPAMGGLNIGLAYSVKEAGDVNAGTSLNASYSVSGLTAQFGYEKTNSGDKYTGFDVGYDLGMANVGLNIGQGTPAAGGAKNKSTTARVVVPMGVVTLKAAYGIYKPAGVTASQKLSVGGRYALSKRTDIYANIANDNKATANKSGLEVGITHNF